MKLARTLRLPAATSFTLGLIVALFSGCKKSESAVVSSDQNIQLRYAWNSATLVGVYEKAGSKNPAWDPWAKAALVEYARSHCLKLTNEPWSKIIATNCANAVRAGCDDPMIEYLYGRFSLDQTNSREVFFEALRKAAQDLQNSSYPSIRKFRAFLHAGIQAGCTYGYGTNVPPRVEHLRLWDSAVQNLQEAIQDKTMPAEDAYEACHALLEEFSGSKEAYRRLFDTLEPALIKNWPNAASTWLLKGAAHIEMAWNGRGGGYANNVTDEGWKVFFAELATAEKALRKSWEMSSNSGRISRRRSTAFLS
ncbi:MAG TPA: hypothetical protein VFD66_04750 [Verrucomicrobiae bacterium]|nr:hypothetical protein [Verrucomicrobiae bacterium]